MKSIREIAKEINVPFSSVQKKLKQGMSVEEIKKWHDGIKKNKIFVDYKGKKITLTELSKITGISYNVLYSRYQYGTPLLKKKNNQNLIKYQGKEYTKKELACLLDIPYNVLKYRLSLGWDIEEIKKIKPRKNKRYKTEIDFKYKPLDEMIKNGLNRPNPYI